MSGRDWGGEDGWMDGWMDDTLPVVKKRRINLSAGVDYNLIPKKKLSL